VLPSGGAGEYDDMSTTVISSTRCVRDAVRETVSTFTVPAAQVAWTIDGVVDQIEVGTAQPDTHFPLGSTTKIATASLALQMVGDGTLDLDAPIADALPASTRNAFLGVTLRHLLSHSGGLENAPPDSGVDAASPSEFVRAYRDDRLLFRPGAYYSYANAGYIVVGHLVEQAMGLSWTEGVRAFLLDPMDLRATFFMTEPIGPGVLPDGHVRRPDGNVVSSDPPSLGGAWAPAGGLAMDARSLVRLVALHLRDGRSEDGLPILEPSLVAEAQTSQVSVPDRSGGDAWGLGWMLLDDGAWFGHDGNSGVSVAQVRASGRDGFAVAMLANCVPVDDEWRRLLEALAAVGVEVGDPAPEEPQYPPPPIDPAIAGHYENGSMSIVVEAREAGWWLRADGRDMELRPAGRDRCVGVPDDGGSPRPVVFLRDGDGGVGFLHCDGRIARRCGEA
jgi:CubicO group peptidase (beta-lactamase class C family)